MMSLMKALLLLFAFAASSAAAFWYGQGFGLRSELQVDLPRTSDGIGLPRYREGPPSESLSGRLSSTSGTVLLYPRTGGQPRTGVSGMELVQGEGLSASPSSSVTVGFDGGLMVTLSENTVMAFPELVPPSVLFWLRHGDAQFLNPLPDQPLSVRVLDGLLTLKAGSARIAVEPDSSGALVSVASGSATLSQVDRDNETRMLEIPPARSVYLDAVRDRMIFK